MKTKQEILEQAIRKAIDGGWSRLGTVEVTGYRTSSDRYVKLSVVDDGVVHNDEFEVATIIFNHDFAKALWGEEMIATGSYDAEGMWEEQPTWQARLQDMVIADDPIEYLSKHI